jgi:hypothetical protein
MRWWRWDLNGWCGTVKEWGKHSIFGNDAIWVRFDNFSKVVKSVRSDAIWVRFDNFSKVVKSVRSDAIWVRFDNFSKVVKSVQ